MTTESLETRTEDGDFKFIFKRLVANSLQRRHSSCPLNTGENTLTGF